MFVLKFEKKSLKNKVQIAKKMIMHEFYCNQIVTIFILVTFGFLHLPKSFNFLLCLSGKGPNHRTLVENIIENIIVCVYV